MVQSQAPKQQAHVNGEGGQIKGEEAQMNGNATGGPNHSTPADTKSVHQPGSDAAILIDDESDTEPPAKRQRIELIASAQSNGGPETPSKGRRRQFHGCPICMSNQNHAATLCPVVQAGPESIQAYA